MSSIIEKEPGPTSHSPPTPEESEKTEKRKREYKDFGHDDEKPTRVLTCHPPRQLLTVIFLQMQMSTCQLYVLSLHSPILYLLTYHLQIELKAEDLYDKEKVDLETIVIEDVFKLLQCDDNGLDQEEADRRLGLFGPNKLEQEEQNAFLQVRPHLSLLHFTFHHLLG